MPGVMFETQIGSHEQRVLGEITSLEGLNRSNNTARIVEALRVIDITSAEARARLESLECERTVLGQDEASQAASALIWGTGNVIAGADA